AGIDAAPQSHGERMVASSPRQSTESLLQIRIEHGCFGQGPGEQKSSNQVGDEDDAPESSHVEEVARGLFVQQWEDDRQGVLREKLLSTKNNDEKPEAVAKARDQGPRWCVGQMMFE